MKVYQLERYQKLNQQEQVL